MTGGQHIAISLMGMKHGLVEVSYVVSYENFGIASAWIDDAKEKTDKYCNETTNKERELLKAVWGHKASVPKVDLLKHRLNEGEEKILHVCLTPPDKNLHKGSEHKFKLLGVRVY